MVGERAEAFWLTLQTVHAPEVVVGGDVGGEVEAGFGGFVDGGVGVVGAGVALCFCFLAFSGWLGFGGGDGGGLLGSLLLLLSEGFGICLEAAVDGFHVDKAEVEDESCMDWKERELEGGGLRCEGIVNFSNMLEGVQGKTLVLGGHVVGSCEELGHLRTKIHVLHVAEYVHESYSGAREGRYL